MNSLPDRRQPDDGIRGGVPGRVGEQVVQDLDDAPPVRRHPGQVRRQVDVQVVPATAPAKEQVPGLVHQGGNLHGLGVHRQGTGLDAGHVQQVADQTPHADGSGPG